MQSRRMSLIEQFANIGSGFIISSLLWHFVIQPLWNIETSVAENLQITTLFTLASPTPGKTSCTKLRARSAKTTP